MPEILLDSSGVAKLTTKICAYFDINEQRLQENHLNAGHVLQAAISAVESCQTIELAPQESELLSRATRYADKIIGKYGRIHSGYIRDETHRGGSFYYLVYEDTFDSLVSKLHNICERAGIKIGFDDILQVTASKKPATPPLVETSGEWSPGAEGRYIKALAEGLGIEPPPGMSFRDLWNMFHGAASLENREIAGLLRNTGTEQGYGTLLQKIQRLNTGNEIERNLTEELVRQIGKVIATNIGGRRVSMNQLFHTIAEECGVSTDGKSSAEIQTAVKGYLKEHDITLDRLDAFVTNVANPSVTPGANGAPGYREGMLGIFSPTNSQGSISSRLALVALDSIRFLIDNPEIAKLMYPVLKEKLEGRAESGKQKTKPTVKPKWYEERIAIGELGAINLTCMPRKDRTIINLNISPANQDVAANKITISLPIVPASNEALVANSTFQQFLGDVKEIAAKELERIQMAHDRTKSVISNPSEQRQAFFGFCQSFSRQLSGAITSRGIGATVQR